MRERPPPDRGRVPSWREGIDAGLSAVCELLIALAVVVLLIGIIL